MALVKWDPWREIADKCDRYKRAVGWPPTRGQEVVATGDSFLREDIPGTDTEGVIKLEIPEIEKEDFSVTADHGALTTRGERKEEKGKLITKAGQEKLRK